VPNGTAAAPGLCFSAHTNTGFWRPATDTLAISTAGVERARFPAGGALLIGTTSTSPNPGHHLSPAGGHTLGNNNGAQDFTWSAFTRNGTALGFISQIGTTGVNSGSVSDYRLKDPVALASRQAGRDCIRSLSVRAFKWKTAPEEGVQIGFFAHELQEIVPEAVAGRKDATDEEGKAVLQAVDHSRLVPRLVLALQDALDQIDALNARISAFEKARRV
jgi:hypothetical protein